MHLQSCNRVSGSTEALGHRHCSSVGKWRKKAAELVGISVWILCMINSLFAPKWKQKSMKERIMWSKDYYSKHITYWPEIMKGRLPSQEEGQRLMQTREFAVYFSSWLTSHFEGVMGQGRNKLLKQLSEAAQLQLTSEKRSSSITTHFWVFVSEAMVFVFMFKYGYISSRLLSAYPACTC